MLGSLLIEIGLILMLTLANGVFAGAEVAILSMRNSRVEQLRNERRRGAQRLFRLRRQPERFLATVQVGITVIGATAAAFGGASLAKHVEPLIARADMLAPHSEKLAFALVVAGVSYASLVLGELVPKSLALRYAEGYSLGISRFIWALSQVARPLIWLLTASSNVLLRPFGDKTTFSESLVSPEEIQHIIHEATQSGTLSSDAGEIASRAMTFAQLRAADVMIPRHAIDAIPRDAPQEQVWSLLLEHGHSRMPVYGESLDDIVGYITAKDALAIVREKNLVVLEDIIRRAYFIPETALASTVLEEFRRTRQHLAIVVDEHGGVAGLVTLDDLVEELVGEMFSEHEHPKHAITVAPDGSATVMGDATIREVNRELHIELPEGESWTSIAGYCLYLAGHLPKQGSRFEASDHSLIEVVDASPRAIVQVRITPRQRDAAAKDTPTG